MVMPGATTRKPRVNRLLVGRRTALTVCQAISMAITVVLPAPVASFRASRSEEHTSELQSLMRISYAVFCLKKKIYNIQTIQLLITFYSLLMKYLPHQYYVHTQYSHN